MDANAWSDVHGKFGQKGGKGDKGSWKGDRQSSTWKGSKGSKASYQGGKFQGKPGFKHGKSSKVARLNLPSAEPPQICAGASYTYAAKGSYIDVLTPAWHSRSVASLGDVNLSFHALEKLQMPSGGFKVSPLLLGHLGATEPGPVLNAAKALKEEDVEILGAQLVLKAAEFYNVHIADTSEAFRAICSRCEKLISKDKEALDASKPVDLKDWRRDVGTLLDVTFGIVRGLWSFFELWEQLLPAEIVDPFKHHGGVLCTRFFLVDLASAAWSPYEIDKSYPLFRCGKNVYMGQLPRFEVNDGMRQGHQLEAAWVKNSHVEEEKILMALQLPSGRQVLFAAAPDALDPSATECFAPIETEAAFAEAGYKEAERFPYPTDPKTCRIWRKGDQSQPSTRIDVPLSAYVEIKKTTHLNGLNGGFKLLNYWLQARLMKAGAVCVAFADERAVISHGQKFSLQHLEHQIQERFQDPGILPKVWASLMHSLEHVCGTREGRSHLRLRKHRGFGEPLREDLQDGWGEMTSAMETDPFEQRAAQLFIEKVSAKDA